MKFKDSIDEYTMILLFKEMSKHMHCNYKLKHAVTAAVSLIAFGFHATSYGLGLGDLDVKSNLGQPLKASVNILGANDLKDTSCLSLAPNSDLSHVNFILGPLSGDIAKLTISSNGVINEPIVNLSIIAGCDSSIRRDYVLLIDPPLNTQAEIAQINNIEDSSTVRKVDIPVDASTDTLTTTIQNNKNTVSSDVSVNTKNNAMPTPIKQSKTVAQKSSGVTNVPLKKTADIKPKSTQAKLSISGGGYVTTIPEANMQLRLDKQLNFSSDTSMVAMNETITIEDEVTVMNKRLAHLQNQINTLQKQNLSLASENKLKSEQLLHASSFEFSNLLPILGSGLLVMGGFTTFSWLRRRQKLLQNHHTEAIWTNTNHDDNTSVASNPLDVVTKDILGDLDFGIKASAHDDQLFPRSMESTFESTKNEEQQMVIEDEDHFSVLDHADVFLSHGRATLAIQLLQNHLLDHPKQSVTIWLFLLDLLAKENLEKLYEQTVQDCKQYFNVKIAEFSKPETIANESLEDFPRLAQGLEGVWNTPSAVVFLDDLIYNNRLEPRAGLAKNLIEELVLLRSMAQENVNSAEVIQLDQKKLAIIEQKEALLEKRKADKLQELADAERVAVEKAIAEKKETDFEFTLLEKY
jgi:hypothetical protein